MCVYDKKYQLHALLPCFKQLKRNMNPNERTHNIAIHTVPGYELMNGICKGVAIRDMTSLISLPSR